MEQPAELLEKSLDRKSIYWKAVPLFPGLYRLDIAIKDVNNPDHLGIYGKSLDVPAYHDEKAWHIVPYSGGPDLSLRQFARYWPGQLRDRKHPHVCPRVATNAATPVSYKRNQDLNFWMQVYNLGINDQTKSNEAKVTYQIIDSATGTPGCL